MGKKIEVKKIGIHIIIILALIRFLVYPLHSMLQEKKALLEERYESYRLKYQVFEKQRKEQANEERVKKSDLSPPLFGKEVSYSNIQVEVLSFVQNIAERNGLTLVNFEMMEPLLGREISEIPVLIRLRGEAKPFIEILKTIEKSEKLLSIRSLEVTRGEPGMNFSLTLSSFRLEK
jgi:Tfp pilus assembly protein PilO